MVEARDGKLLDQKALLVHDLRNGHNPVGQHHIEVVQHGEAGHVPLQSGGSPVQGFRVVDGHACTV